MERAVARLMMAIIVEIMSFKFGMKKEDRHLLSAKEIFDRHRDNYLGLVPK